MTRQNRVLPTGEIVAEPARGTLMGNRGILHDAEGRLGAARWRHKAWIACELAFKGRRRLVMAPGRYTELFFLDEAVALAAGHRPCAECRRAEYRAFLDIWERAFGERPRAAALDRALHTARVEGRGQRRHRAELRELPDGAFLLWDGRPHLRLEGALLAFGAQGYRPAKAAPGCDAEVEVLTPAPILAVLRAGYRPRLHSSAVRPAARPS